jgi:pre-mRNA-processing factor 19
MDTVIVGSDDCSWSLHDIKYGQILEVIQTEAPVTAIEFHPDGLVLGVGLSNGLLDLYDIRTLEKASTLEPPIQTPLLALKFSNKGFHMAAAWHNTCRVYSMHKGNTYVDVKLPYEITSIAFDYYGHYLALSSSQEIQIYYFRDYTAALLTLAEPATSICFGTNSANLIAVNGKQVKFIQAAAQK